MCCDPHEQRGRKIVMIKHGDCCEDTPDCCSGFQRHFVSTAEKLENLEKYKEQIEKELAGVEEAIGKAKAGESPC